MSNCFIVRCGDVEEDVLVILLPCFAESGAGVVLNTLSLQCTLVQFH